jgi:quercetin dioxygenase-like cupin family protein
MSEIFQFLCFFCSLSILVLVVVLFYVKHKIKNKYKIKNVEIIVEALTEQNFPEEMEFSSDPSFVNLKDVSIKPIASAEEKGYNIFLLSHNRKGMSLGSHYHKNAEELLYVISGSISVKYSKGKKQTKTDTIVLGVGEYIYIKKYIVHEVYALDKETTYLSISKPPTTTQRKRGDLFAKIKKQAERFGFVSKY